MKQVVWNIRTPKRASRHPRVLSLSQACRTQIQNLGIYKICLLNSEDSHLKKERFQTERMSALNWIEKTNRKFSPRRFLLSNESFANDTSLDYSVMSIYLGMVWEATSVAERWLFPLLPSGCLLSFLPSNEEDWEWDWSSSDSSFVLKYTL